MVATTEQVVNVVVLEAGLGAVSLVSLILTILNIIFSLAEDEYMVDAPAPVVFFSFIPFGWPFYIVSWIRRGNARRREAHRERVREVAAARARRYDDLDDFIDIQRRTEAPREEETFMFVEDREAARDVYVGLRGDGAIETIRRRKQEAVARRDETVRQLKEISEQLKKLQQEQREADVDVRASTELLEAKEKSNKAKAEAAAEEFDQIFAIEGVEKVRKFGDCLSILISGKVVYNGRIYDKGDWEMRIDPSDVQLWVMERRVGRRDDWRSGVYPDYRLSGNWYCFGDNQHTIVDNLKKGQYLQAVELAATYINSVNAEHEENIPRAFKLIGEVETVES